MRNFIFCFIFSVFSLAMVSCVDDYDEANPSPKLDSPAFIGTTEADTVTGGDVIELNITVVDAPGLIDSVAVSSTDNLGSFQVNDFDRVIGKTAGSFSVTFTVPTNIQGDFDVTVTVYDSQNDDKGEKSPQAFSKTFPLYVYYKLAAATAELTFENSEIYKGSSNEFELEILAEGGIDSINVFSSIGDVELDDASVAAAKGKSSAVVKGTFIAPDDQIGEALITIIVSDELQERLVTFNEKVNVVFEFDLPEIEVSGPAQGLARLDHIFDLDIVAEGLIDSVRVQAFKRGTDEEVGVFAIDQTSYDAIIGESSGSISVKFTEDDYIGYVTIVVTVFDQQGAEASNEDEVLFLNQLNCNFYIEDFLGEFSSNEPGYGSYDVEFTADPAVENRIFNDNFWDSEGVVYYDLDPTTSTVTIPSQSVTMGEEEYTVEGTGKFTLCEGSSYIGSFYVDYIVTNSEGEEADSNRHTFTR